MKKTSTTRKLILGTMLVSLGLAFTLGSSALAQVKVDYGVREGKVDTLDSHDIITGAAGFQVVGDLASDLGQKKTSYLQFQIGRVVGVSMLALGTIFLVLALYGGFLWMTAQGNLDQVQKAQKIIRNGAIGVLIVLSAYFISSYVADTLLSATQSNAEEGPPERGWNVYLRARDGINTLWCGSESLDYEAWGCK